MNWRLLITPPETGAWNMSVDEALLLSTTSEQFLPTIRLYDWQPACLSLGYAQPITDVNLNHLQKQGWTLVRRPTGGRAILHREEITYSITAPQDDPLVMGSLLESYKRISQVLLRALQLMGIEARADQEYQNLSAQQRREPICFEVPSNYEITANGKKLIGSAQARKSGGVLQHGSLPLGGDISVITSVLDYSSEEALVSAQKKILDHATTLETILGKRLTWEEAATAFTQAFLEYFQKPVKQSDLLPFEFTLAQEIYRSKYSTASWNERI